MKSATNYRIKLGVAAALAVVTAVGAGMAALALSRPQGAAGFAADLAPVHEARADTASGEAAEAHTRAALAQAPMNASYWARLAYLDRQATTVMGPKAIEALERSYAVAPYGPDITAWRLRFLYEHWGELTPSLRKLAMTEMQTLARYQTGGARRLVRGITAPGGRMAAQLIFNIGERDARLAREEKSKTDVG